MDKSLEKKIVDLFKDTSKSNFWKSVKEIAEIVNAPQETIIEIVNQSEYFFKSKSNNMGIFNVTTKEKFRKYQSFGKKILGAFNNRIQ